MTPEEVAEEPATAAEPPGPPRPGPPPIRSASEHAEACCLPVGALVDLVGDGAPGVEAALLVGVIGRGMPALRRQRLEPAVGGDHRPHVLGVVGPVGGEVELAADGEQVAARWRRTPGRRSAGRRGAASATGPGTAPGSRRPSRSSIASRRGERVALAHPDVERPVGVEHRAAA